MSDMLVKLYELPDNGGNVERLANEGVNIRRVQPFEASLLRTFIIENFSELWADEASNAFGEHPLRCFIATHEKRIIGFGCYDTTRRGFFGPTGVKESYRGRGIGKALLLACLHAMFQEGYGYAIIGGTSKFEFYSKCCGASEIPNSSPGVYADMLERNG